jgi:hypothetical protein
MAHHRFEPARRYQRPLNLDDEPAERLQRTGHHREVGVEREQHADRELVVQNQVAAEPVHCDQFEHRHHVEQRVVAAAHPHYLDRSGPHGVRLVGETALEDRLGTEALDRTNAAQSFFDHTCEIAALALQLAEDRTHPKRVPQRRVRDERKACDGDHAKQRVDDHEHDRDGDDRDAVRDPHRC